MKKLLFLFHFFVFGIVITAQIQITTTDLSNLFAVGKSWIRYEVEDPGVTMNVGSPGAATQNWVVPNLIWADSTTLVNLLPSSTPYASFFPGATNTQYSTGFNSGYNVSTYEYFQVANNELNSLGSVIHYQSGQIDTTIITTETEFILPLPLAYGASFGASRDSNDIGGGSWIITNSTQSVDAFGSIALPWNTYGTLRVNATDESEFYFGGVLLQQTSETYYNWLTKDGGIFEVDLDTNSATTGTVILKYASLTKIVNTVSVETETISPADFALFQNYPNPFNPVTIIRYSIPSIPASSHSEKGKNEVGFVTLKVYDILGNEIATLVDEYKSAGSYEVVFKAENLSSGIYIYKLFAGNLIITKKMALIR